MPSPSATQTMCPRCGATNPSLGSGVCLACFFGDEAVDFSLDGYRFERELGKGGMGTVYLAQQLRLDRPVAIKVISHKVAQHATARARFEREARLLARLKHPHIVTIHDYGEKDGSPYLVMELVEGSSLGKNVMSPGDAVSVVSEVCDALAYAHGEGIIHRDIKPSNILLDAHGRVKVVDFGIARLFDDDDHGLTNTGVMVGTPHYMAPEVQAGAPSDPRADIYSAGLVLFKLMTGRLPVGDLSVPMQGLEPILRKALAADPRARFQTADELAAALRSCAASASRALPVRERSRRRWGVRMVVALVVSAALVAAYAITRKPAERPGDASVAARTEGDATVSRVPAVVIEAPATAAATADAAIAAEPVETYDAAPVVIRDAARVKSRPPRAAAERPAPGTIVVHAKPWAEVTIDGVHDPRRAEPPSARYIVPSGRRRLELFNPHTKKRETKTVDVTPGSDHDVEVDLR